MSDIASKVTIPTVRKIHFPVIETIDVDGYVLYPGSVDGAGLSHTFKSGVNVILGINGIGKTTLLLLLYRMLTGDRDLRDGEELGGAQRKLIKANNSVFSIRVPDRAVDAVATLKFKLNGRSISITRSLKDLTLTSVTYDETGPALASLDDPEETFKLIVAQLSGLDDFFDWVLLLKYLVFYLEDRRSLVWDKWAQTEVFRILFLPESTQANYKNLLNKALSADSQARNIQSVLTNEQKKLAKLERDASQSGPDDLKVVQAQVQGLRLRGVRVSSQLEQLDAERRQHRDNAARLRSDAERLSQKEREIRERLLSSIFPQLSDYGGFAIASIDALRGCIVCGCTDVDHLSIARAKLHEHLHCPLCDSDPLKQEQGALSENVENDKTDLEDIAARAAIVKRDAIKAESLEEETIRKYSTVQIEKYEIERELRAASQKLAIAENAAGIIESNGIRNSKDKLELLQESVDEYKDEKNEALVSLRALVEEISQSVSNFKDVLISDFQKIIRNFLAEKCELTFRTAARNIGQASSPISLLFPEFHVLMTSGVFRESGTPREDVGSVSESQKEFIELAFRMAVLSASTGDAPCTLVIETPEANLDAVFIPKAGAALNEFAVQGNGFPSTIIATSNLNGSEMIPALLGTLNGVDAALHRREAPARILNLLNFAAKSAALREFSEEYNKEYEKVLGAQNELIS
jgi:hypothetical protein